MLDGCFVNRSAMDSVSTEWWRHIEIDWDGRRRYPDEASETDVSSRHLGQDVLFNTADGWKRGRLIAIMKTESGNTVYRDEQYMFHSEAKTLAY